MPIHSDPDDLALRALGEDVAGVDEHLAACDECRAEVDALRALVGTARTVRDDDAPQAPPETVWAGVRAELGLGSADLPADELAVRRQRTPAAPRSLALVAAALVGLVAGVAGTLLVTRDDEPGVTVVAATVLRPLEGDSRRGDAEVVRTASGRELDLVVRGLPRGEGYYEVWLLDTEHKRLVPIGLLEGARGRFTLPEGIDLSEYPVVDISLEPADGDPAHSGNSLARGTLRS